LDRFRTYSQPWCPQLLHQVSGSSSLRHPAQSLEPNFLFTVPAWTTGPPQFPQLRHCGVLLVGTLPLLKLFRPSLAESWLRMQQHPQVYRSSVRSKLTLSNYLTSWLSRQVLLLSSQAAVPLSRTALALLSSWIRSRTVSFFLSRDSGASSGMHATPVSTASIHL